MSKAKWHRRKSDESWGEAIAATLIFIALIGIGFTYLWLLSPEGAAWPR